MTYQVQPIEHYLEAAAGIVAINAKHQRQVTKLAQASRRIDFHVDMADAAADQIDEENPKLAKAFERAEQKHLRQEEKYADVMCELEDFLPKREIENVAKQLIANIDALMAPKTEPVEPEVTLRVAKRDDRTITEVAALLPANYRIVSSTADSVIVAGRDHFGWTAQDYVIPRLRSAMICATVEAK